MHMHLRAVLPPILLIVVAFLAAALALWLGWSVIAGLFLLGAVILVFDVRGRRLDFRNARRYLATGFKAEQVARTYQYSWCSRAACRAAAAMAGEAEERAVAAYYRDRGYRWFHIFPDNTFTLNSPFLKLRFWQITLFGNKGAKSVLEKGRKPREPEEGVPEPVREAA